MPKIDETVLKHHIRDKTLERVYFLYGNEPFLIKNYAKLLCDTVCGGKPDDFNCHTFDGKKCTSGDFVMEAQALPFTSERKCVSVCDFDFSSLSKDEQTQLDELFSDLPETTVLVIWQVFVPADLRKNAWKTLIGTIQSVGCTAELRKPDLNGLIRFLRNRAGKQKIQLSHENAQYLIETCGEDMSTLQNELEKVCAYRGEGEVTRDDIDAVAVTLITADAFSMVRSILKGDYDSAYRMLDRLFFRRVEPANIMGALSSVYVDAYRVKVASASDGDFGRLTSHFDYKNKEFKLRNAQRDFKGKSTAYLRAVLELLHTTDLKLKSARTDRRVLMEELIGKLARLSVME